MPRAEQRAPVVHQTVQCAYCFKWYITPCATKDKAAACPNLAAAKLIANDGTLIGSAKFIKAKAKPKGKRK